MEMTGQKIELFVRDLEKSARFYEQALGFRREAKRQVGAGGRTLEHLPLRHGDIIVALGLLDRLPMSHPILPRSQDERVGMGVEFCFYVAENDLDAWHDRARAAGDYVVHALAARAWGARDFRIIDPDGYYVRVSGPDTDQGITLLSAVPKAPI